MQLPKQPIRITVRLSTEKSVRTVKAQNWLKTEPAKYVWTAALQPVAAKKSYYGIKKDYQQTVILF